MARARVQGRGVASVSRAGRARGVAARRRRTSIFSHVDFFCNMQRKYAAGTAGVLSIELVKGVASIRCGGYDGFFCFEFKLVLAARARRRERGDLR